MKGFVRSLNDCEQGTDLGTKYSAVNTTEKVLALFRVNQTLNTQLNVMVGMNSMGSFTLEQPDFLCGVMN